MKKRRYLLILFLVCAVTGAYFLGTVHSKSSADDLLGEIDSLTAQQSEAAVVKRVSQQMENIAYQQKAISDQQRERAEEQSAIARRMRDVAEQESRSAHQSEEKAKKAAADAENERANALYHQKIAEKERDEANLARSIADTLTYVTLGTQLGQISLDQYESGHYQLAARLAFTGWSLLKKFKGNFFQTVTYESLSKTSGAVLTHSKSSKGRITATCRYAGGYTYVSDYGEIGYCTGIGAEPSTLYSNSHYDFRDVLSDGVSIFALSFNGSLCRISPSSEAEIFALPGNMYCKLVDMGSSQLLAIGKNAVTVIDKKRYEVERHIEYGKTLSATVKANTGILLFFEDGTVSKFDGTSDFTPLKSFGAGTVTAAFYDSDSGIVYLGYDSGEIRMISGTGETVSFSGHSGRISSISASGGIIISASFDKTIDIRAASSPYSVTLTYREWPLCISSLNDDYIVAGFSDGSLRIMNISTGRMAEEIRKSGNSSLNVEEWNKFVGENVPYMIFDE